MIIQEIYQGKLLLAQSDDMTLIYLVHLHNHIKRKDEPYNLYINFLKGINLHSNNEIYLIFQLYVHFPMPF